MIKEEFQELIDKAVASNILIIVEGKKDREALQKLGISNITELSKKPLYQVVEEASNASSECAILTDLDRKGKEIYGKLNSQLQRNGVKIDNKLRNFLFNHTKVRQIEGLTAYFKYH